jgi:UDP-glucuronate 4-epimerase
MRTVSRFTAGCSVFGGSVMRMVSFFVASSPGSGLTGGFSSAIKGILVIEGVSHPRKIVSTGLSACVRFTRHNFRLPPFFARGYGAAMNILVTGGAGFIGSHFVEKCLALGHGVAVLDDFNDFYDPAIKRANIAGFSNNVPVHEIDIRDGGSGSARGDGWPVRYHCASRRAGRRAAVHQGSEALSRHQHHRHLASARGGKTERRATIHLRFEFERLWRAEDRAFSRGHGAHRHDLALRRHQSSLANNSARTTRTSMACARSTLRFFTVYGPRPAAGSRDSIRSPNPSLPASRSTSLAMAARAAITLTSMTSCQGVAACLTYNGLLCEVFNLGESQTTTLNELIAAIERALGKEAIINKMPEQPGDVPLTYADITKARAQLGYNPHTQIAEGIPKFVEWFHATRR